MKLRKLNNGYYSLYDSDGDIVASNNPDTPCNKKLSKENCDEIFGIIDVGALVLEECNNTDPLRLDSQKYKQDPYFRIGYLKGFNKAMELNKDKLFTLEDMKKAFNGGWVQRHNEEGSHYKNMEILIQSIQQPTEIDVEIVTHVDLAATPTDSRHPDAYLGTDTGIPFLDENGCLILTKKK